MSVLYAIPNYDCILKCDYCDIRKIRSKYNREKYLEALANTNASEVILFGGEPLLYLDRFMDSMNSEKITSISTTLLYMGKNSDEEAKILGRLIKYKPSISTTFGINRFETERVYLEWMDNISRLHGLYDLDITIMVTLTQDILNIQPVDFTSIIKEWRAENILFEFLILPNGEKYTEFYKQADEWLCRLYDIWPEDKHNLLEDQVKHWYHDCSEVYTLTPSGEILNHCPHSFPTTFCEECLSCERNSICKPCSLQKICVFPKKFYQKVISNENKSKDPI